MTLLGIVKKEERKICLEIRIFVIVFVYSFRLFVCYFIIKAFSEV